MNGREIAKELGTVRATQILEDTPGSPFGRGKLSPKCPKCGANPQFTTETITKMINAMFLVSDGLPLTWRWDFRRRRLLK